ncbi:MAG: NAD-dependent malic enzyme [Gammaproteobacteria bacterium]
MRRFKLTQGKDGRQELEVPLRGTELLAHAMYSKGTSFTHEERRAFGLEGLLPHAVGTIEIQRRRMVDSIARKADALEKYIGLASLQDRNEVLYYRVLIDHLEEFLPIVYTPTVARACQDFSQIFRRGRGLWITPAHKGRIFEVLGNAPFEDVRLIVVTDNERILGVGDQGAGGMGIPIGKLALYVAAAGIHPAQTLPISLDVGTDNAALLADERYLGWREKRLRGPKYDELVEEFVQAAKKRFPKALLQWEDFKKANAFRLMDRYRSTICSFNDDIQGTAAIAAAAMMAGARVSGVPLTEQRAVILGAGAAGIGIARLIRSTLERAGLRGEALTRAVASIDSKGLLVDDGPVDDAHKKPFVWPRALAESAGLPSGKPRDLEAVIRAVKPTVLIGTSGEPGTFTEAAMREMARHVPRPVILPMSNPTANSEATPADVLAWTEGRALVATGSPFAPVPFAGRNVVIGQANNAFVFPGVGLGAILAEAREVTDSMFTVAADRLAMVPTESDLATGSLFPSVRDLRPVTAVIAEAVIKEARDCGVGKKIPDEDIPGLVAGAMWKPEYPVLKPE